MSLANQSLPFDTTFLEMIPAAVYAVDADGRIAYYNRHAVEIWGQTPVPGSPDWRLCGALALYETDGTPIDKEKCLIVDVLARGITVRDYPMQIDRPDGKRVQVVASVGPIRDSAGNIIGAVNTFREVAPATSPHKPSTPAPSTPDTSATAPGFPSVLLATSADAPLPGTRPRLLVVEDHIDTCRVLTRILRNAGYDVCPAHSAAEARAAAAQQPFDIMVSDIGLPDVSGYELMRELAAYNLKGIALSGYGMDQDLRESQAAGFVEHLTKPVNFNQLDDALRRVLTSLRNPGN